MNLSPAQKRLIREICQIQYDALTRILISPDLGTNEWGEQYIKVLDDLDIPRSEFDDQVSNTTRMYQDIGENPNTLFESLTEIDLKVFEYILVIFDEQLKELYPKAYENLLVKLEIWKDLIKYHQS